MLVHCERGQRRSPTLVLAFLISRGKTTDEAIGRINRGYIGTSCLLSEFSFSDPLLGEEDWARSYRKVRGAWIKKLKKFEKFHMKILEFYRRTEAATVSSWNSLAEEGSFVLVHR